MRKRSNIIKLLRIIHPKNQNNKIPVFNYAKRIAVLPSGEYIFNKPLREYILNSTKYVSIKNCKIVGGLKINNLKYVEIINCHINVV